MNKFTLGLTIFYVLLSGALYAQEELLLDLKHNQVIKTELQKQSVSGEGMRSMSAAADTLFLPFYDDFSVHSVWPSADRWTDSSAFINFNYPLNPPTVGVATFDGLNSVGNPYDNSNANANGLCDLMTSKPINLFNDNNGLPYNPGDSIFLVFYYQRKGRGDNPESTDSLVLQFLNPATQVWVSVWKTTGTLTGDTDFNKVKISINDVNFRQNGFRFRFKNYGSKTGMLDLWHVDYVNLNKFLPPFYDSIRDYAFVYQGISLLNNYSAVPWKHFTSLSASQQQAFVKTAAELTLRNNNDGNPFPISLTGTSYDQYANPTPIVGGSGSNNIVIPLNSNVNPPANLLTNSFFTDPTSGEQAKFTMVYEIGQTSGGGIVDDYPQNDTLRYVQDFYNYYAYDDGTAELGYGVNGVGASLAYKFDVLKPDTLRAVQMFFSQLGLSVTNQIFRIAVWSGGASGPSGAPVYEKFNQTPNYIDSINGFYTYLTDPLFLSAGTWFFGFIQNNAVLLNLGLDVNTPADPSRKFINTSGSWTNSQLPGMWMIRPVFSGSPLNTAVEEPLANWSIGVYPVPAKDILYLHINHPYPDRLQTRITDVTGKNLIFLNEFSEEINVSGLAGGFYLLHISDPVNGNSITRKIIVDGK